MKEQELIRRGAQLDRTHLRGADLREADLREADLSGARHNKHTVWPDGFTPPTEGE